METAAALKALLKESSADFAGSILCRQDGVMMKGSAFDDKSNHIGCLMLLAAGASGAPASGVGSTASSTPSTGRASPVDPLAPLQVMLAWVPYTMFVSLVPHLAAPAVLAAATCASAAEAHEAGGCPQSWTFAQLYPVSSMQKLQRKTNLRGKRIIVVTRAGCAPECPLIFQDGGITKFFEELRRVCELKPIGLSSDEFIVESVVGSSSDFVDAGAVMAGSTGAAASSPLGSSPSASPAGGVPRSIIAGSVVAGGGKPGASGTAAVGGAGSGRPSPRLAAGTVSPSSVPLSVASTSTGPPSSTSSDDKNNRGAGSVVAQLLSGWGVVNTLKGGSRLATAVASSVVNSLVSHDDGEDNGGGFDVCERIQDVEALKPAVLFQGTRRLGAPLSREDWARCFDADGRLVPELFGPARFKAFHGGVDPTIRGEVWAALLGVYPLEATAGERAEVRQQHQESYARMRLQWQTLTPDQIDNWPDYRDRRIAVDKDVERTDRTHPQFADDGCLQLRRLRDVLMTHVMSNFDLGYCQGMSDVASSMLLIYESDAEAFWTFKMLIKDRMAGNFYCDVKRQTMPQQLKAIETLLRVFAPTLHAHLDRHRATDVAFCFRWLLVLFKREFGFEDVNRLWDTIFASPHTPQYEIFVAAAILRCVAGQIVEQSLSYDELLKFTNAMSLNMRLDDVLLLAEDFYETVGSAIAWKHRTRSGENATRPTLATVLEAYQTPSSPVTGTPLRG